MSLFLVSPIQTKPARHYLPRYSMLLMRCRCQCYRWDRSPTIFIFTSASLNCENSRICSKISQYTRIRGQRGTIQQKNQSKGRWHCKKEFLLFCSIIHINFFSEEGPSEFPDNVITKGDGYTSCPLYSITLK